MARPGRPRSVGVVGETQVYEMEIDGREHRVETSVGDGWRNEATWWVDGEEIAATTSRLEDNLYLVVDEEHELADSLGAVRARFTSLSKPLRATWFEGERRAAEAAARIGVGGLDLVPEPGSPAAVREERMRSQPRRHASLHVAKGVADVVVPILIGIVFFWLARRVDLPSVPWADVDLPPIPWPSIDLPTVPWPDWELPGWVRWALDHVKYVVPILIGLALGLREMRRRREQDELRERLAARVPRHAAGSDAERGPGGLPGDLD